MLYSAVYSFDIARYRELEIIQRMIRVLLYLRFIRVSSPIAMTIERVIRFRNINIHIGFTVTHGTHNFN